MVEKPDYVITFVRPSRRSSIFGDIGIYMSGVMFMIPSSEGQEKSLGKFLEA